MKIQVTETDIIGGLPQNAHFCPVAIALRRQFPTESVEDIEVQRAYIRIGEKHYLVPSTVFWFTYHYDHDKPVEPFEFEIDTKDTA